LKKPKKTLDGVLKIIIIGNINKEKEMEKAKETKVAKRPSKKVLMAQNEAMGVEQKIVNSLGRSNIETIQWVIKQIS